MLTTAGTQLEHAHARGSSNVLRHTIVTVVRKKGEKLLTHGHSTEGK